MHVRLRAADQNTREQHECAADEHLYARGHRGRVHVAVPDPGNHTELDDHHRERERECHAKARDEKRQRVPHAAERVIAPQTTPRIHG